MSPIFGCKHRWVEVGRTFTAPVNRPIRGATVDAVERIAHGFTSIEQRCEDCGKVSITTALGRVEAMR